MSVTTVKLQNVIMQYDADANLREYSELMHRSAMTRKMTHIIYDAEDHSHIFTKYKCVDFTSYFNCLQISYFKEHTNVKKFKFGITFKGKGSIEFTEVFSNSKNVNYSVLMQKALSGKEKTTVFFDIPDTDKPLISFAITATEEMRIYDAAYYADIEESDVRDISISLVSTTFRKEAFIKHNIKLLKENILDKDTDMNGKLFVHIMDNGRTLDPTQFDCENLKVHPNQNVGGAGGFTRGMIESLHMENKPTHVLLMDDDVMVMPESIFRTYYLLRIVKPEFADCFVSGAMFDYDDRYMQYEDVGYVHKEDGSYGPLKKSLDMRKIDSLLKNEQMAKRVCDDMYAGWWFCCIPVKAIEKNGLPLPVFVRGDDVEFSIRNKARFLTLNGICIWHVGFAGKFNAAMELYQVHRNSLIIQSASNICGDVDFIKRMKTLFWKEITRFAYNNAEQIIDAIDDYMKGPDYFKKLSGEQCLKEHSAKNDKLVPYSDLPAEYNVSKGDAYSYRRLNIVKKAIYVLTINGHLLPGIFLRRWPEIVSFDWFFVPGKNFRRKILIAVNAKDETACVRRINRRRCFRLIKRYRKVMKNYNRHHETVDRTYAEAFSVMTSESFWREYLGI